jgi:hypothetical protein
MANVYGIVFLSLSIMEWELGGNCDGISRE